MKRFLLGLGALTLIILGFGQFDVQAKNLEVQATSQAGNLPRNGVRIPLLQINLRAQTESVTVKSVVLSRSGLSSSDDIGRVWIQDEYVRLTRARQFTNDDILTLEFTRPLVIAPHETKRLTVLANLEFSGGGQTLRVDLQSIEADATLVSPNTVRQVPSSQRVDRRSSAGVKAKRTRFRYDRSKYRVKCRNSRCQLVLR